MYTIRGGLLLLNGDGRGDRFRRGKLWGNRLDGRCGEAMRGLEVVRKCGVVRSRRDAGMCSLHSGRGGELGDLLRDLGCSYVGLVRDHARSVVTILVIRVHRFLLKETEDVIEDKVSVRLLGQEKRLRELAPKIATIGHFADDLDDDPAICRGLRVDRVDEDFAVLEPDRNNLVVDFLRGDIALENLARGEKVAHLLPITWAAIFALCTMDKGRVFGVKAVESVWLLVDEGVVLGDELPSDFGGNDIGMDGGRGGVGVGIDSGAGCRCSHDGAEAVVNDGWAVALVGCG